MTWQHVNFWHSVVQPLIDQNFQHWGAHVPPQNARADVGWDWARIYGLALLHNTMNFVPGTFSGPARAFAMVVFSDEGLEIPVGMLTVVPEFNCRLENVTRPRTFAWYLADAPMPFYRDALGVGPVVRVAAALLDTAIQSGVGTSSDGSVLLHADPNGGQKLADFYLHRCKMRQLPLDSRPISPLRRKHVDQYFFLSASGAAQFSTQFDNRR